VRRSLTSLSGLLLGVWLAGCADGPRQSEGATAPGQDAAGSSGSAGSGGYSEHTSSSGAGGVAGSPGNTSTSGAAGTGADDGVLTKTDSICESNEDCVLRAIPLCHGEDVWYPGFCVNVAAGPFEVPDCTGNQQTGEVPALVGCECADHPHDDTPEWICVGIVDTGP
jgi:hypothetical protein